MNDTRPAGLVLPRDFDAVAPSLQPERRLLLAVLQGAVSDVQKYATAWSGRGRQLFADAEAWFASTATDRPLDFESICQALDLDPSFIRGGLRRWCIARRRQPSPQRTVHQFPGRCYGHLSWGDGRATDRRRPFAGTRSTSRRPLLAAAVGPKRPKMLTRRDGSTN